MKEREKAGKKAAKDRAYAMFWSRTGLDQQQWRYFRALAELYFSRSLVFGAPDARYGDGRPVYERTGPEREQWTLVGVACPDPCRLRAWAEELPLLVPSHEDLAVLAGRAWAPFQVYVLDPDTGAMDQERVPPSRRPPSTRSGSSGRSRLLQHHPVAGLWRTWAMPQNGVSPR
ncbi:hypothetical protein AB0C96_28195 [Streptomyces sp. NPDC048506]|uniref:hypothetical protein n=1 Tax=Streptomyces sp. NPDC048506 TaxID=3155028 RepID=UPI0034446724